MFNRAKNTAMFQKRRAAGITAENLPSFELYSVERVHFACRHCSG